MAADDVEESLIRRVASGETAAMQYLLLKHRDLLTGYAQRHMPLDLRRTIDPQDVVQDVCIDALRHIARFSATDMRSALLLLMGMARDRIAELVRTQRAAKRGGRRADGDECSQGVGNDTILELLADLVVYERTPSQSAVAHELLAALQRAIERLPADYRMAIRLHYIESLPVEEVARRMGRTDGSVHMLCNRAIRSLRAELDPASLQF